MWPFLIALPLVLIALSVWIIRRRARARREFDAAWIEMSEQEQDAYVRQIGQGLIGTSEKH